MIQFKKYKSYETKELIGLDSIRDKVYSDFINKKLHHSLLFVGKNGSGKATLAYHIINKILSHKTSITKSIDSFSNTENSINNDDKTFQLIKNLNHPDLLIIEKEKDDKEIKIEKVRTIIDFITLPTTFSENKIVIIDSIDEMNTNAQNAILKILEEPLNNRYIFLICHNKNNILATIKSRCFEISIPEITFDNYKKILSNLNIDSIKEYNDNQLKNLFHLSDASISQTISIIQNDGIKMFENIKELLSSNELNIEKMQIYIKEYFAKNFSLFSNFIFIYLYDLLTDNNNLLQSEKFSIKNSKEIILNKFRIAQEIINDVNFYNMDKELSINILFQKLMN